MRAFVRALKAISVITLSFFSWTFLPLFQIPAYASSQEKMPTGSRIPAKDLKPEEKFEKLLEDIREKTNKAVEKSRKGEEPVAEIEVIKSRKTEIEALDANLKQQFAATEKRLKDSRLPSEVIERHQKFVRHYQNNLKELVGNLEQVEKAQTKAEVDKTAKRAQEHLEKAKPPRKHKTVDPNKLPTRMVKAKGRQPKLKNEEWEKELKKKTLKDHRKSKAAQRQQSKPIIVAANGSLTGLLAGADSVPVSNPSENYIQLAATTTDGLLQTAQTGSYGKYPFPAEIYPLPWQTDMIDEDNQETPETHITDAIQAKAAELKNHPVLMFNWIYNNIQLVPSYGSIQGADMCLQTKQCNETDIASLTIAMFRAAGWPARYEFVTAELDINRFMENMGGFTDPQAAITFAATGGIPVRPVMSGGKITAVQFERVYATSLLPEGFYIGAGSLMRKGWSRPMWMPIDVSLKHYISTPGIDINAAVPFDAQSFTNQIQSTATINEAEGYVANVNSALIQQTMQDYQARVQNYISQNTPTATVGDIIGKREIKQINFPMLPPTGWTKPVTARVQSHTLPDSMKYAVSFVLQNADTMEIALSYTISIAEVAGKRVTLSYLPATTTDEQIINSYGGIFNVPAYLVNVKPQIKIEGVVAATGSAIGLGKDQAFMMQFISPAYGTESVSNIVTAGAYYGIGINPSKAPEQLISDRRAKLAAVKDTACISDPYSDDCAGELLYTTAMGYFFLVNGSEEIAAKSHGVIKMKDVSEAIVSAQVDVSRLFGVPKSVAEAGMMIDVDRNIYVALSQDGDQGKIRPFMMSAGQMGSAMEHQIFEIMYQTKGVSTVQVLKIAIEQNIPIYTITQNNISSVLPVLQISSEVKNDIQNAVNAGKIVVTPKQNVTYYSWTGSGYMVIDPQSNAAAYMISTNLAGGGQCLAAGGFSEIMLAQAGSPPSGPITPAVCHVRGNAANSLQSAYNIWCAYGALFATTVGPLAFVGWMQLTKMVPAFMAMGPVGALIIAVYILFTLALIAAVMFWAHSCYQTLISKKWDEYLDVIAAKGSITGKESDDNVSVNVS